jgi:hypothetical protein
MNGQNRPTVKRLGRASAVAVSVGAHVGLAFALAMAWRTPATPVEPTPIAVSLVDFPVTPPPPPRPPAVPVVAKTPPAAAPAAPKAPVPSHGLAREARTAAPTPSPVAAAASPINGSGAGLSESQIASAGSADDGGGSGGGDGAGCHMAQRVQAALRRDSLVRAAVAQATPSRAIMVWNGDWVQSGSQDGKGLAAVREAIVWEVAFAPQACKAEHMRGLILLSMNQPGAPRLAVGSGDWRWSDLLIR